MKFDRTIERIPAAGLELDAFVVPWDSELFGFPVAEIERIAITDHAAAAQGLLALGSWLDRNGIRLASCRLPSDRLHESMLLEEYGFRFVEMIYRPTVAPIPPGVGDGDPIRIGAAGADDLPAIEAIAASAFSTSRFLLDWRLDGEASHRRYRNWIRSSVESGSQKVLKATLEGALVGFFVVEERDDRTAYWHLTAIATAHQGRGLGRRLWAAMMARHRSSGLDGIATTISAHNAPVMNIYARLGFRFEAPHVTLHWLRP